MFTCRSLGTAPSVEMQGRGQCHVAAVSERGDDQTTGVTQILIAVLELGVRLLHHTVVNVLENKTYQILVEMQQANQLTF